MITLLKIKIEASLLEQGNSLWNEIEKLVEKVDTYTLSDTFDTIHEEYQSENQTLLANCFNVLMKMAFKEFVSESDTAFNKIELINLPIHLIEVIFFSKILLRSVHDSLFCSKLLESFKNVPFEKWKTKEP